MRTSLVLALVLALSRPSAAAEPRLITVATARSALVLVVAKDGRLHQLGYGRNRSLTIPDKLALEDDAYPTAGNGFVAEPALQVVHGDGNTSTDLMFVGHEVRASGNVQHTQIRLKDRFYPFFVTLHFEAFRDEDVIRQWVELRHDEAQPVVLSRFASAAPVIDARGEAWLTQLQGDYMREAELVEERLTPGIKLLDSKLGVRAHQRRNPSFLLSLGGPAQEESGEVIGGTLAWSGNFQLAFEVDQARRLRALCGINPFGAQYRLPPGKTFTTPAMLWTWSDAGKGPVSRNLHRWARRHGIRDGDQPRPVLLNNWE
ncbi:MAG TPA: glycoside hydrolase family 36 N-terminal domain-containing protein, partial [Polyangia bacterium]|nr:glycoside hydrolase family 36 N-terminal domain-containing protein [Polyangia bacterium]